MSVFDIFQHVVFTRTDRAAFTAAFRVDEEIALVLVALGTVPTEQPSGAMTRGEPPTHAPHLLSHRRNSRHFHLALPTEYGKCFPPQAAALHFNHISQRPSNTYTTQILPAVKYTKEDLTCP